MKKSILTVLAAGMMCGCATNLTLDEMRELDEHLAGYYVNPDPGWVMSRLPVFEKWLHYEQVPFQAMGFVYGAAKSSAERKEEWKTAAKKCDIAKRFVDIGLEGKGLDEVVGVKYEDYAPELLDLLWGYFMATGDAEAPRRVIHRGGMRVPEWADVDLTARAAVWSSCSLAKDHPVIMAELESFAQTGASEAILNFFGTEPIGEKMSKLLSATALGRIKRIQEEKRRN